MQRIPFQTLYQEFHRVLVRAGLNGERAALVARLFAENQRDGVHSHGLNRFPGFIAGIRSGKLDIHASPKKIGGLGVIEQWEGNHGIGLWNAHACMGRAIELAREHGMGCVGLRNTSHWMRAGAYGLQAAEAGFVGICWTNTLPLMPPWGSAEARIGNNPLVIAVPRPDGPLLLDLALSQYSNGKLEVFKQRGKTLPLPGGYDRDGNLTCDPAAILASRRALPIGYWKGSALAVMLDTLAALLSGGLASHQIGKQVGDYAVSQVFVAINAGALNGEAALNDLVNAVVNDLRLAKPLSEGEAVRYPGEGMLRARQDSLAHGVPVDEEPWRLVQAL